MTFGSRAPSVRVAAAARRRRRAVFVVGLAVMSLFAFGCGPRMADARSPRLVLLFAPCSVNRLYLGPYNPAVRYTPALSAFAREGSVFLRHQTEAGQSGLAYASLLTGTQADRHGVYRHPSPLRPGVHLLAEAFAERGYDTYFWNGHLMASADLGYGRGVPPEHVYAHPQDTADLAGLTANDPEFAAILDRLRRNSAYRAFVQVNFTVTHPPYINVPATAVEAFRRDYPEEWPEIPAADRLRYFRRYRRQRLRLQWDFPAVVRERGWTAAEVRGLALFAEAHYKAGIHLLDSLFGRLVQSIREGGLLEQSLIAFTADHGETLFREGTIFKFTHGLQLSPDVIQVPFIVRLPGRRGRALYPGVSRSIDVYPTLLGLAGLAPPPAGEVDGKDLSRAMLGTGPVPALRAFSHTMPLTSPLVEQFRGWLVSRLYPSTSVRLVWTAVRDGDTYVRRRREEDGRWTTEAFDLARDPGAEHDVFDPGNPLHRELARELVVYKEHLVAAAPTAEEPAADDDEARDRLRSMGYIR